uniref:Uncharacterized protein n=1 Tax=Peronospora matthiolae TaxID=2874970 RepID=A0AAV1V4L6_9STRA
MRLEKSMALRKCFFFLDTVTKWSSGPLVSKRSVSGAFGLLGGEILPLESLKDEI